MSQNRNQNLSYTERNQILSARVNFAHYVQKRQLIQQGDSIFLNLYPPDNDASIVPLIKEGEIHTTLSEFQQYINQVTRQDLTPIVNPTVPSPPSNLSATPGNSSAIISFNLGSDGGSPITDILYLIDPSGSYVSSGSTTSPITITGLTNGISYTISLKAVNGVGESSPSGTVNVTPSATLTTTSFTTVGTTSWTAPSGVTSVEYLVVGGGGGSGGGYDTGGGGGGGAGMVLTGTISVTPGTSYTVVVGDGGDGGISIRSPVSETNGSPGEDSIFDTLTALGGGGGYASRFNSGTPSGGGTQVSTGVASVGGSGGGSAGDGNGAGGGGGGNTSNGSNGVSNTGGNGGSGVTSSISGSSVTYGVGGRGANGNTTGGNTAVAGTANTGNGARGGGTASSAQTNGAKGGSGIIILRYTV